MTNIDRLDLSNYRIGVDLGGTKIECIALNPEGREVKRLRIAAPRDNYENTLNAIADLVRGVENDLPGDTASGLPTLGIGIPGAVSPATGLIKNANSTWLIGTPLKQALEQMLSRPVRMENDANCFTVSEATDGAGAGSHLVFGVILGTGVGGGLVVGGQTVTGANAIAGEWGHNPLPWPNDTERPGPDCYCGKTGCLETFLSGPAFSSAFELDFGQKLNPAEIDQAAKDGNVMAEKAMQIYIDRLGRGLAHVINMFDPNVIVLGGGLSNISRLYEETPKVWANHVFSDTVNTKLLPPKHGDSSGVRGAAWLWPPA